MNKIVLIGGSLLVVAALVVGGIFVFGGSSDDSNESSQTQQDTQQSNQNQSGGVFSPVATDNQEFEATLTGNVSGSSYEAVILSDGEKNAKYSGRSNGEVFEIYNLADGTSIVCNNGTCFKVSGSAAQSPISADQYEYSDDDYNRFRDMVTSKGQASCPAGTCSVWEYQENNATVTIYLASDNKVSKLETTTNEGSFTIEYAYKDVNIDIPTNVQTIPGQ